MLGSAGEVLIVEDDPDYVVLLQWALKKIGCSYQVEVSHDGEQAVRYLTGQIKTGDPSRLPLLILTDLKMPRQSGHELIEWVRSQRTLTAVPIVMISSSDLRTDSDRATSLGANAYAQKPLERKALVELVRSLLETWLPVPGRPESQG